MKYLRWKEFKPGQKVIIHNIRTDTITTGRVINTNYRCRSEIVPLPKILIEVDKVDCWTVFNKWINRTTVSLRHGILRFSELPKQTADLFR